MAGKKPLLRIGADVGEARRALAELKSDAKDFDRIRAEARVTVETAAAKVKLDQLNANLTRLAAQEYTPKVALEEGRVVAQIARIEEKLRRLDGQDVKVKVRVDSNSVERSVQGLARAIPTGAGGGFFSAILSGVASTVASIGSLAGAVGKGVTSLASLIPVVGESAAGFLGLGAAMLTAIPLLGLFAAGIAVVIGVLGALAASFASAIAGAAILATAFGGALLGPVAIAIAAFVKLISIFKAFGAQQKASKADSEAAQSAAMQQAQAQQTLSDAYANLAQQTRAARDAQVAATEAVKDDLLARQQASLGIDQAKLNTKQAEKALQDFKAPSGANLNGSAFQKFTDVNVDQSKLKGALTAAGAAAGATKGDSLELQQLILNVRQAKLNEKQANDSLHDSNTKLAQDRRTESDFLTKGLAAYPGYLSALRQVRTAQEGVRRATLAASKAQDGQGKGLETLTPKELGLVGTLRGVAKAFKDLFSPAVDKALSGLVRGLQILSRVAKDPKVKAALSGIGDALRTAFVRIARFLSDPASRKALVDFLNTGRRLVKPLTDLFIALGKLVRDLATNALPSLVRGLDRFAKRVTVFEEKNGGAKKLASTVRGLIGSFKNFVDIGSGLSSIILAFFRAGKESGDKFTGSLGQALKAYGRFLNSSKGQDELKAFFSTVRRIVKEIVGLIDHFYEKLVQVVHVVKNLKNNILNFPKDAFNTLTGGFAGALSGFGHPGRAAGGPVFGAASGHDNVLTPLSGGEYIIRRSVVDALGLPFLNALNAGGNPRAALAGSGGGGTTHITNNNHFHTPGGVADPRVAAAQLSRELARRAG
jgi:hypothetical protein